MILIVFSSLEQTKVSNYFHSHKTGWVMELLRFVSRYFFRYTLFNHKLTELILPCIYALLPNKTDTRLSIPEVEQHVANSPTDILVELKQAALNSVLQSILILNLKDAFTISHQICGSIFKTLVYRTTNKTIKTLLCGFVCFLH